MKLEVNRIKEEINTLVDSKVYKSKNIRLFNNSSDFELDDLYSDVMNEILDYLDKLGLFYVTHYKENYIHIEKK